MSGQPNIYAMDQAKFRQQYLSNLNLQANIDEKNLQANKLYKKIGETPTQLTDTRTTAEKLLDIERLKIDVRNELSQIADGSNANQIVQELNPATLSFLAQHIVEIVKEIKPKYKYGVPADVFIPFIEAYMDRAITTNEVSFGLQQTIGRNILLGIQQIQNQLIRVSDLDNLRDLVTRIHTEMIRPTDLTTLRGEILNPTMTQLAINKGLIQTLISNIDEMKRIIPTTAQIQDIGRVQNEGLKNEIMTEISDAIEPLPTRVQIQKLIQSLETAIQQNDPKQLQIILQKINEIISLQPATLGQLTEVKKQLEDITSSSEITPLSNIKQVGGAKQAGGAKQTGEEEDIEIGQLSPAVIQALKSNKEGEYGTSSEKKENMQLFFRPSKDFDTKLEAIEYLKEMRKLLPIGIKPTNADLFLLQAPTNSNLNQLKEAIKVLNKKYVRAVINADTGGKEQKIPGKTRIGNGIKNIKGEGISKGILDKVDYTNGIISKNKFVPFGKFFIDTNRLNDNIISVKRGKGINVNGLPVQRVSNELGSVMRTIVGNGQPKYNEIEKLTDDEKKYLYKISKTTNILNKLSIPTPNKDDDEKDINQFEIYKGELLNGNDSSELIKKFKLLIVKMVKRDLLPKGQANEILMDMATFGY